MVLANSGFSVFMAFAVFGAVGHLAQASGRSVAHVIKGGAELAFVVFPEIINQMPFARGAFGVLFFLALVVAGLTSTLAMVETVVSTLEEKYQTSRRRMVTIVAAVGLGAGVVFTTRAGAHLIDVVDHFVDNHALLIVGIAETILVGWLFRTTALQDHLNLTSRPRLGPTWRFLVRYYIPAVLVGVIVFSVLREFSRPFEDFSAVSLAVVGGGGLLATVAVALLLGRVRNPSKSRRSQ